VNIDGTLVSASATTTSTSKPRSTCRSIARALVEGGALSCSLHNPAVRGPQLDGRWLEFSPIAIPTTGGVLRWRARMDYDAGTGLAQGEQVYDELDRDARSVAHVELPVRFRLVGKDAFEATASASGFERSSPPAQRALPTLDVPAVTQRTR